MPAHVYAIAEWVLLAACDRGMGIWASTWSPPVDEHTAKYTACIDKAGRTMVERVVPDGGFEYKVRETPVGGQLIEENARCLLPHAPRC